MDTVLIGNFIQDFSIMDNLPNRPGKREDYYGVDTRVQLPARRAYSSERGRAGTGSSLKGRIGFITSKCLKAFKFKTLQHCPPAQKARIIVRGLDHQGWYHHMAVLRCDMIA